MTVCQRAITFAAALCSLLAGLANPRALAAEEPKPLGWLSKKYEVDKGGPATISTGKLSSGADDPGGKSYGSYQLASKRGLDGASVKAFVETYYDSDFGTLDLAAMRKVWLTPGSPEFDSKWREVVLRDGDRFKNNEHEFIYDTHYQPVVAAVKTATGVDLDRRGDAVRNAVWSTAVQHGSPLDAAKGHGHTLISSAITSLLPTDTAAGAVSKDSLRDKDILGAIYKERESRNARDADRYKRELGDALSAQASEPDPGVASDLNETALGQFSKSIGIRAAPDRSRRELRVDAGQFTFDASGVETFDETSRKPSVPGLYSGVRIGRGYDLSRRSAEQIKSDLMAAGVSEVQAETYAKAAGLKGKDAVTFLEGFSYSAMYSKAQAMGLKGEPLTKFIRENTPQSLTLGQQQSLFALTYARAMEESRTAFRDFERFPPSAKEAVVDMVFDRGLEELRVQKPGFVDHVNTMDWDVAAATSKRNGAGARRNAETRRRLEEAANPKDLQR
ncbi:hypothetical protein AYO47_01785 [Planctomyces sp. SCGC AG-212-M04]|nr:hypothetical protein AYO47_01785 [Planctomyces sp. SCGC AG-212-M04]